MERRWSRGGDEVEERWCRFLDRGTVQTPLRYTTATLLINRLIGRGVTRFPRRGAGLTTGVGASRRGSARRLSAQHLKVLSDPHVTSP